MELSIVAVIIDNLEVTSRFVSSIKQYTKNYELILIDNGSKDKKTINFIKKNSDGYYRFNKRTDLAKAWNKGIELSKGKYIAVVNNDTIVGRDWFRPLKEVLNKKKVGMVSPITNNLFRGKYKYNNLRNFNILYPIKCVKYKDVVWGEFCIFNKKALKEVNGYCELYKVASAEDLDMCFQLYDKNYDIFVDPRVFVYHEGGASQISSIISKKKRDKVWN